MKRSSTWKAFALVSVTAVSISGCAKANDSHSASNKKVESAPLVGWTPVSADSLKQGGTLNLGIENSPTDDGQWNPNTTEGAEVNATTMEAPTSCSVIRMKDDGSWEPDPNMATSVELVSKAPQTVEVKLNPDAVWEDGSPITADDFKASFAALSGKDKKFDIASSAGFEEVKSFDVVSPTDFKVVFAKAYADWPAMFLGGVTLPKAIASDPDKWNKDYTNKPLPSCGPFKYSKVDNNAKVFTLVPNPKWWGDAPKLSKITFKVMDQATQAQAFSNGEIDSVEVDQNADSYETARKAPNAMVERSGGLLWTQVTFNGLKPGLDDQKVRQAIAMSIDRTLMAHQANDPVGAAAVTQGSYIFMPGQDGYKDNVGAVLPFDTSKAQDLLKEAGYTLKGNSWTKDGKALTFKIVVPSGTDTNIARAKQVQASLAKVHITVKLDTVPVADYFTKIQTGDYEMATFSWQGTPFPISSTESLFTPAGKPGGDGQNYSYITDPNLEGLWAKANVELDPAKRIEIANQIDTAIATEAPMVPIAPSPIVYVMKKTLANYGPAQFKSVDWSMVGFTQ
ncbi:ABC transporter family substrate-binding protein [Nocardioides montaniterrae]